MENLIRWFRLHLFHRKPKDSVPIFTLDIGDSHIRLRNVQVFMSEKGKITCTWVEEPSGENYSAGVTSGVKYA